MEGMQNAAENMNAATPTTGTGTPLMTVVSYLLYTECALILLLSVPFHVPYRKDVMVWLRTSPNLWQLRVVYWCINAFLAVLLADTYLRLDKVGAQINVLQHQHLNTAATSVPIQQAATSSAQTTGSLNDLYSSRFRGQRDFYIISFTLFCSSVLYQLHLLLIKMERYMEERNALRARLYPNRYPAQPTIAQKTAETVQSVKSSAANTAESVKQSAAQTVESVKATVGSGVQSVRDAAGAMLGKVDAVHGRVAEAEGPNSTVVAEVPIVTVPAAVSAPVNPDMDVGVRKGYTLGHVDA